MRTSLGEALAPSDVEHLGRLLQTSEAASRVGAFLRERTFVEGGALRAFRGLPGAERERLLSELIWRLTCVLEGSETATLGSNLHRLTADFAALIETDGRAETCTVVRDT